MPAKTHGGTGTRLYRIWKNMKARCYRKSAREYGNYGGRGISICEEWKDDFLSFRNWALSNGYKESLTIDRIDVNKDYKPSNCRWITNKEQQNNRRDNRIYEYDGKSLTLSQWSELLGMNYKTLEKRIENWGVDRAIDTPLSNSRINDISGMKFGRLTVLSLADVNHGARYNCVCDCGNEVVVRSYSLVSGETKSCGCLQHQRSIENGKKVGMLSKERSRKIKVMQYNKEGELLQIYNGYIEASEKTGICKSSIIAAANGKRKTAGGCLWHSERNAI